MGDGVADAVLAAGAAAVPQFEVGELAAAGVGGERGESVPVAVGESELRAGVGSFGADDDSHPGGRRPGQVEHPGVASATHAPGRGVWSAS